jgi:hypothetical protein
VLISQLKEPGNSNGPFRKSPWFVCVSPEARLIPTVGMQGGQGRHEMHARDAADGVWIT